MEYLPIFLDVNNKPCLLVGGGVVAYRKAQNLLKAGAALTIVAKTFTVDFSLLKRKYANLSFIEMEITAKLLTQYTLIVAATDDEKLNQFVSEVAKKHNIPVNVVDDQAKCSFIQPAIVNRSPILVAISSGGTAPVLAKRIREKIEGLLPSRLGLVAEKARELRPKIKNSNHPNKRLFWERLFDSLFGHFIMNGNQNRAEKLVDNLLKNIIENKGLVYLTGAGPGDPELLTIKALNILQRADIILYDHLVSAEILDMARRDATLVPVGKSAGKSSTPQSRINELMVKYAEQGNIVCRLKGGDPFIYGRGGEEAEYLKQHHIPHEVIPGITAAAGCAASAGIPLTHRGLSDSVTFITAKLKDNTTSNLIPLAKNNQTLAIYMGLNSADEIQYQLLKAGFKSALPIAIVERGTTPRQRVISGQLDQLGILAKTYQVESPAIIYIGETARFAHQKAIQDYNVHDICHEGNILNANKVHHLSA